MSLETLKTKPKNKLEVKKPKKFKVILFNDDFTPFVFVEQILIIIFNKTSTEASSIAQKIHEKGSDVVGIYNFEIAQTKQSQTIFNARKNEFPLLCEIEESDEG